MRSLLIVTIFSLLFAVPSYAIRYTQYPVYVAASMVGTVSSSAIDTQQLSDMSYQLTWTGATASGSFVVQGSNQIVAIPPTGLVSNYVNSWTDLPSSTYSFASNGTTGYLYNLANVGFRFIRLKYVQVSGTGTLTGVFFGKGP